MAKGPRPKKTASMAGFTAHHMLVFALHSIELLRPFVPTGARATAFWDVWVLQVYILQCLLKPTHTYQELVELDKTVHRMFKRIEDVPEYKGFWVPKFHYASHAAMDILRFGPVRANWCMMYEAKNQPLKRGCKRSNFHKPAKSTAVFWAESTDFQLRKRQKRPALIEAGKKKEGDLSELPDPAAEAIKERLGSSGTYSMLQSASKLGICYFRKSFALIPFGPDNSETICRIQDIVQVASEIYLFVDVFPHEVMHHDENGVLQTTAHVLDGV